MYVVIPSWAALLVALAIVLWQAFELDGGATAYPRVVIAGALLSAGALLFTQVAGIAPAPQRKEAAAERDFGQLAQVVVFVVIWAGYVLLLPWLGFMAATWLAIVSSLAGARARTSLVEMLSVAAFVFIFTILIKVALYVPMPQGWLDEQLEILLYSYL